MMVMDTKNGKGLADGDSNHTTLAQVMEEVDVFLTSNSYPSNLPTAVELLLTTVEDMITDHKINAFFLDAVARVSRLSNTKATVVLRKAMSFLEEEFRILLIKCDDYTTLPPEAVTTKLAAVAGSMNAAGYSAECSAAYMEARRRALDSALENLGYQKIVNTSEIKRGTLKPSVAAWVSVAKACSSVLFPAERSLRDAVFSDSAGPGVDDLSGVAADLLSFARAVAEQPAVFSILEMYDSLEGDVSEAEMLTVRSGVREMAATAFFSITTAIVEPHKTMRPQGPGPAVQVVTRGVMKYLTLACARRDTLERVLEGEAFSRRVEAIMDILEETLEAQSEFHEDRSLKHVFMMNNTRFLDLKVRESEGIRQVAGEEWRTRRSSRMRRYHQEYLQESWGKVLECLEGRLEAASRPVLRLVLRWRLKSFNAMFEEVHSEQKRWALVDERLRARLRVSIWAAVVPAYRAFLTRFLDLGRHDDDKLVLKYGPVDIETMIDELFYGK